MTFKELKDFVNSMTEVELLQFVNLQTDEGLYEIDVAVNYRGRAMFVTHMEADDGS